MKLHTVFITYNRLELTKRAIESYLETVTVPYTLSVVDNDSEDGTAEWILFDLTELLGEKAVGQRSHLLSENRYPGYATNLGWSEAPVDATHLHRADNDFAFIPGWCDEVQERFQDRKLGQLGLRTDEEEAFAVHNVGGNCIIKRKLWDAGLRYDETPWPKYPPGFSEDSYFSPTVKAMGYKWARVRRPCIRSIEVVDENDPYYQRSWGDRKLYGFTPE